MFKFNIFRRKEQKLLKGSLNKDVVEGFIDKIEDIICIVDNNYKIEYINKPEMHKKISYLPELLEYNENKELYNEIIGIIKEKGLYINDIELKRKEEKISMYIAIYYIDTVNKYLVYIKDTDKYMKNQYILKEKLNKSNEELKNKELFVANLSHEIKTPINIIIGMIYFLKSTKLDETQNEYVNKLEQASDLLTELVSNILNVAKSDNVTNIFNTKEKFILKNLIDKVSSIFEDEFKKKNIQWSIESNFDLNIEIYEDKTRLEQVFINLLSNSVKYTEKGYVELVINKIREDIDAYIIRCCIKDTGIGIKREDTIKIFQEFEQTSDPTIKEREGFGLGLPLVKKIIESMDGKIWVESSYGLGSKFFFELKLTKNKNSTIQQVEKENTKYVEDNEVQTIEENRVLIVDDNKMINEITEKILEEIDLKCDVVEDGMEAIKKVEEKGTNYYSLILMDIHMPKYNGYDISRIMKKELNVKTPIVALTATNITDEVIENNKEYIHSYIQKPIKPRELKDTIKNILERTSYKSIKYKKRKTVLLIADKIKNWEIIEKLNDTFNVICTVDPKDIKIITSTKKLDAIIYDDENKEFQEKIDHKLESTVILLLSYNIVNEQQTNITFTTTEGYSKKVEDIKFIGNTLLDIIDKQYKECNMENEIKEYDKEISQVYKFLYDSLVNLTSVRSKETGAHLMRTQEYIKIMLKEYERSFKTGEFENQKKIEDIGTAATLHDIGKVGISDEILNKPGKLTEEEYNKIKDHTIIGHQILENTSSDNISNDILEYAKEITLHHHEKYDGSGYPDGLNGDDINIISRIMAIIDVYDALVNDRVYKKAMPYDDADKYIISQSGKAFDPKVVNVFMNIKEQLRDINEKYKEE